MFFRMVYNSAPTFLPFCHKARVWQTDGQTEFSSLDRVCIACSAVKMLAQNILNCAHGSYVMGWVFKFISVNESQQLYCVMCTEKRGV